MWLNSFGSYPVIRNNDDVIGVSLFIRSNYQCSYHQGRYKEHLCHDKHPHYTDYTRLSISRRNYRYSLYVSGDWIHYHHCHYQKKTTLQRKYEKRSHWTISVAFENIRDLEYKPTITSNVSSHVEINMIINMIAIIISHFLAKILSSVTTSLHLNHLTSHATGCTASHVFHFYVVWLCITLLI